MLIDRFLLRLLILAFVVSGVHCSLGACEGKSVFSSQQTDIDDSGTSADSLGQGGSGTGDSGTAGQGTCGPQNCTGCCDTSTNPPTCRQGTDRWMCGSQGEVCVDCRKKKCEPSSGGGMCVVCYDGPYVDDCRCGPNNCTGCCDWKAWSDYRQCVPGTEARSCGSNGFHCKKCAENEICTTPAGASGPECVTVGDGK